MKAEAGTSKFGNAAGKDVRKLKRWLVDDDNEESAQSQPSRLPTQGESKQKKSESGFADTLVNRLYTPEPRVNEESTSLGRSTDRGGGIRGTVSRKAKNILHHKDVDSDDEDVKAGPAISSNSTKTIAKREVEMSVPRKFREKQVAAAREAKPLQPPKPETDKQRKPEEAEKQRKPEPKGNVSRSFDRSMLFQHLSDSEDSGEDGSRTSMPSSVRGSPEKDKGGSNSKDSRQQTADPNQGIGDPLPWGGALKGRPGGGGRIEAAKSRVEQFLRGSPRNKDFVTYTSPALSAVTTPREDGRAVAEKSSIEDGLAAAVMSASKNKTAAEIAAEMRERERERKSREQLFSKDSLRQEKVSVPVVRLATGNSRSVSAELVKAPAALSAKVSASLRNKIVLLGADGSGGLELIRPTAAVGAAAVVVVSGAQQPEAPKGKSIKDVRIPVVAVSDRHAATLALGKICSLNLESPANDASPRLSPQKGSRSQQQSQPPSTQSSRQASPRPAAESSSSRIRGSPDKSGTANGWRAVADVMRQPAQVPRKSGDGDAVSTRSSPKTPPRSPPSPPRTTRQSAGPGRGKEHREREESDSDDEDWKQKMRRKPPSDKSPSQQSDTPPASLRLPHSSARAMASDDEDEDDTKASPPRSKLGALNAGGDIGGPEAPLTAGMKEVLEWRLWGDDRIPLDVDEGAGRDATQAPNMVGILEEGGSADAPVDVRQPVDTSTATVDGSVLPPGEKSMFFLWVDQALGRKPEMEALERERGRSSKSRDGDAITYTSELTSTQGATRASAKGADWSGDLSRLSVDDSAARAAGDLESERALQLSMERRAQLRDQRKPVSSVATQCAAPVAATSVGTAQTDSMPTQDTPPAPSSVQSPPGQTSPNEMSYLGDSSDFEWRKDAASTSAEQAPSPPVAAADNVGAEHHITHAPNGLNADDGGTEIANTLQEQAEMQKKGIAGTDNSQPEASVSPEANAQSLAESDRALCDKLLEREAPYMAAYVAKLGSREIRKPPADIASLLEQLSTRLRMLFSSSLWHLRVQATVRLRELCRHKSSDSARQLVGALAREAIVIHGLVDILANEVDKDTDAEEGLQARVSAAACFRHLALDEPHFRTLQYANVSFLDAFGRVLRTNDSGTVLQMTAAAVANLSVDSHENRANICTFPSIIKGLDRILDFNDIACQESSLAALWNLSLDVSQVPVVMAHLSLPKLASALENGTPRAQHRASGFVRNLLLWSGSRQQIADTPAVQAALQQLKAHGASETAHRAEMALELLETSVEQEGGPAGGLDARREAHNGLTLQGSAMKGKPSSGATQPPKWPVEGGGVVDGGLGGFVWRRGATDATPGDEKAGSSQVQADSSGAMRDLPPRTPPAESEADGGSRLRGRQTPQAIVSDAVLASPEGVGGVPWSARRPVEDGLYGSRTAGSEAEQVQALEEGWVLVVRLIDARVLALQAQHESSPALDRSDSKASPDPAAQSPPSQASTSPVYGYFVVSVDSPPLPALFAKSSREQAQDGVMTWRQPLHLHLPTPHGFSCVVRISLRIQSSSGTSIADARPIPLLPLMPYIQNSAAELPLLAISRKDRTTPLASARISLFMQPPLPALSPLSSPSPSISRRGSQSRRQLEPKPLPSPQNHEMQQSDEVSTAPRAEASVSPVPSPPSSAVRAGEQAQDDIRYRTAHSRTQDDQDTSAATAQGLSATGPKGMSGTHSSSPITDGQSQAKRDLEEQEEQARKERQDAEEEFELRRSIRKSEEQLARIVVRFGRTKLQISRFMPHMVLPGREELEEDGMGDTTEPTISEMREDYDEQPDTDERAGRLPSDGPADEPRQPGHSSNLEEPPHADEAADRGVMERRAFWEQLEGVQGEQGRGNAPSPIPPAHSTPARAQSPGEAQDPRPRVPPLRLPVSAASEGNTAPTAIAEPSSGYREGETAGMRTEETDAVLQAGISLSDLKDASSQADAEHSPSKMDASVETDDLGQDAMEVASTTSTERREMGVQCQPERRQAEGSASAGGGGGKEIGEVLGGLGMEELVGLLDSSVAEWREESATLEHARRLVPRLCRLLKQLYRFERTREALVVEAEGQADATVLQQLGLESSLSTPGSQQRVTLVKVLRLLRDLCAISAGCLAALQQDNSIANTLLRILRPRNAKGGAAAVLSESHGRASSRPSPEQSLASQPQQEDADRRLLAAELLAKFAIRSSDASSGQVSQLLAKVQDQWWSGLPGR